METPMLIKIKGYDKVFKLIENYFTINEKEKSSIDKFIYSLLNNPDDYEEYLEMFFLKVVKKQISLEPMNNQLFNKFIVEASENKKVFNEYVKKIIKMNYHKYHSSITEIINNQPNLVDQYIKKNIDKINFENKLEMKIVDNYISRKLSINSKLANSDIRFIVKLLIDQYSYEMSLKIKVKTITFIENLNEEKMRLPTILQKTKSYLKIYGIFSSDALSDGTISINTDNFRIHKSFNPFLTTKPLFYLLVTCFHELQHAKQNNMIKNMDNQHTSLFFYKNRQEKFVINNDTKFYYKNHSKFYSEIDSDIVGCEHALEVLKKYSPERYNEIKEFGFEYLREKLRNRDKYDESFIRKHIDLMVKQKPEYIQEEKVLQLEYNEDGSKKTITEILNQTGFEFNDEDLIYYIITKNISECSFDVFKNQIKMLSSDLIEVIKKSLIWEINNISKKTNINNYLSHDYNIVGKKYKISELKLLSRYFYFAALLNIIEAISINSNYLDKKELILLKQR